MVNHRNILFPHLDQHKHDLQKLASDFHKYVVVAYYLHHKLENKHSNPTILSILHVEYNWWPLEADLHNLDLHWQLQVNRIFFVGIGNSLHWNQF